VRRLAYEAADCGPQRRLSRESFVVTLAPSRDDLALAGFRFGASKRPGASTSYLLTQWQANPVVRAGGIYVIDDMLPQANWPAGHGEKVVVLLEQLAGRKSLAIVPPAWASGLVVAVKRSRGLKEERRGPGTNDPIA
jgi:hypothetical protein